MAWGNSGIAPIIYHLSVCVTIFAHRAANKKPIGKDGLSVA
jgi:hypothetical protein